MGKRIEEKQDINMIKIWCPDKEHFQYIKVCERNCKKKDRCEVFQNHFQLKLF